MSELKWVTLIDPNGVEVNVTHPADINNLVYGQGYKIKGNASVDKAADTLSTNPETVQASLTETSTKK